MGGASRVGRSGDTAKRWGEEIYHRKGIQYRTRTWVEGRCDRGDVIYLRGLEELEGRAALGERW